MKRRVKNWVHLHNQVTALQDMMPDRMERETLWLSPVMPRTFTPFLYVPATPLSGQGVCLPSVSTWTDFATCFDQQDVRK